MATLTISLVSTPLTGSRTFTASDADVQSLINYLQRFYPGTTPGQALIAWANDWVSRTVQNAQNASVTQIVPPPLSFT